MLIARLTLKLNAILACSTVLFFPISTFARTPLSQEGYERTRVECTTFMAKIGAETTSNIALEKLPASLVAVAEEADPEISQAVRDIEAKLPRGIDQKQTLATELLELRALKEDQGQIRDLKLRDRYRALELRNSEAGLIKDDNAGQAFLTGADAFPTKTSEEKFEWLQKFGASHHINAKSRILGLLNIERDPKVRKVLRQLAVARGFPVNYKKSINDLRFELMHDYPKDKVGLELLQSELRDLPESILEQLIIESRPPVIGHLGAGLVGRETAFIEKFMLSRNPEIRLIAARALDHRITDHSLRLLRRALRDSDPRVSALGAIGIGRFQSEEATKLLAPYYNSSNELVAKAARLHWKNNQVDEAIAGQKQGLLPLRDDPFFPEDFEVAEVLAGDSPSLARDVTRFLKGKNSGIIQRALKANDPLVRLRAVESLEDRFGAEDTKVLLKALEDPVIEIRLAAVKLLGDKRRITRAIRKELSAIAIEDEEYEVRSLARSHLSVLTEEGVPLNLPHEVNAANFTEALRKQFGNPQVKDKDIYAMAAASHIYRAAEADSVTTAEELVQQHRAFLQSAPPAYKISNVVTDTKSSFKAGYYLPKSGYDRPRIVAIAGSQNFTDALADATLGVMQVKSKAFQTLLSSTVKDLVSNPADIIVTGHSLGGGLAQVFGHELIAALEQMGRKDLISRVRVVSWNGFGGQEPLQRMGKLNPEIVKSMHATNYYVPSDPVSRIGTHIGDVVRLPDLNFMRINIANRIEVHGTSAVEKAVQELSGLSQNERQKPHLKFRVLTELSRIAGPIAEKLQNFRYRGHEIEVLEKISQARVIWAREEGFRRLNHTYDWLGQELNYAIDEIADPTLRQQKESFALWLEYFRKKEMTLRQRILPPKDLPARDLSQR